MFTHLFNCRKIIESEEKPETPSQTVSQSSTNTSTSVPAETTSTAGTAKETESKDANSCDINDAVNSSSNESIVNKTAKDTENLKRPLVEEEEEVKQKKRKEDHSQNSKSNYITWFYIKYLNIISRT